MEKIRPSLLISTYNSIQYLEICLLSVSKQVVMPLEVLIADDGSTIETKNLIDSFRAKIPVPIMHFWQEDDGFKAGMIRNKAIAGAKGNYIIQIDGDIIIERHFVKDHIKVAKKGALVGGSRVWLSEEQTKNIFDKKITSPSLQIRLSDLNGWRFPLGRDIVALRLSKYFKRMRGCNMGFWLEDLISVNGYNEDIMGWGYEDDDVVLRTLSLGREKRHIKLGGVAFHMYHKERPRDQKETNRQIMEQNHSAGIVRCENGLDKYLSNPSANIVGEGITLT